MKIYNIIFTIIFLTIMSIKAKAAKPIVKEGNTSFRISKVIGINVKVSTDSNKSPTITVSGILQNGSIGYNIWKEDESFVVFKQDIGVTVTLPVECLTPASDAIKLGLRLGISGIVSYRQNYDGEQEILTVLKDVSCGININEKGIN